MRYSNLINALLFGLCALLWFGNGLRERDLLDFLLAAVWLWGTVIWIIRFWKEKKK